MAAAKTSGQRSCLVTRENPPRSLLSSLGRGCCWGSPSRSWGDWPGCLRSRLRSQPPAEKEELGLPRGAWGCLRCTGVEVGEKHFPFIVLAAFSMKEAGIKSFPPLPLEMLIFQLRHGKGAFQSIPALK